MCLHLIPCTLGNICMHFNFCVVCSLLKIANNFKRPQNNRVSKRTHLSTVLKPVSVGYKSAKIFILQTAKGAEFVRFTVNSKDLVLSLQSHSEEVFSLTWRSTSIWYNLLAKEVPRTLPYITENADFAGKILVLYWKYNISWTESLVMLSTTLLFQFFQLDNKLTATVTISTTSMPKCQLYFHSDSNNRLQRHIDSLQHIISMLLHCILSMCQCLWSWVQTYVSPGPRIRDFVNYFG